MSSFRKFINEVREVELSKEQFIEEVRKNCKPTLRVMKKTGYWFNRSEFVSYVTFYKKKTRSNRNPLDTLRIYHEIMNKWFKKKFGWKARSENVLFVYGKKNYPDFYIFPVGTFKFIWSKKIRDVTGYFGLDAVNFSTTEEMESELDESEYTDKNIIMAIKSGNEIMINCKEYYGFHSASWIGKDASILEALYE